MLRFTGRIGFGKTLLLRHLQADLGAEKRVTVAGQRAGYIAWLLGRSLRDGTDPASVIEPVLCHWTECGNEPGRCSSST